jgi:hypothetical protein
MTTRQDPADMTAIDCSDCYLAIEIGDGVKRALIGHFTRFIATRLEARRIAAGSAPAHEQIDREAWRLAAKALGEVAVELDGALDESRLAADPHKGAQDLLATVVETTVAAIEQDYLADTPLGFEALAAAIASA